MRAASGRAKARAMVPPKKLVPRAVRIAEELAVRSVKLRSGRSAAKAGRSLGELGAVAIPKLVEAAADASPFVRSGALFGFEAAALLGAEVVGPILAVLANETDPRVIETACGVLGRLGPAAVAPAEAALKAAASGTDERAVAAAKGALATLQ